MRRSLAFTLVEMLLVVAIIVVLIAMLLPSLQHARRNAWTVRCETNLNAIGIATHNYGADNSYYAARDAWYNNNDPNDPANYAHYHFVGRYAEHIGGPKVPLSQDADNTALFNAAEAVESWRCPAERDPAYALTYAANGVDFLYYSKTTVYTSGRVSRVRGHPGSPNRVVNIVEANTLTYQSPTGMGVYDVFRALSEFTFYGPTPAPNPRMIKHDDPRHGGVTTLLFFDGHVEIRQLKPEALPVQLLNPLDPN